MLSTYVSHWFALVVSVGVLITTGSVCSAQFDPVVLFETGFDEPDAINTTGAAGSGIAGGAAGWTWDIPGPDNLTLQGDSELLPKNGEGFGILYGEDASYSVEIEMPAGTPLSFLIMRVTNRGIDGSVDGVGQSPGGGFEFFIDDYTEERSADGPRWNSGDTWARQIDPGVYTVGIRSLGGPRNVMGFEDFQVLYAVPEPATALIVAALALGATCGASRRRFHVSL